MTRAGRIAWILAVIALAAHRSIAPAAELPNVVLIIADDQAWTDYGFMGHPHLRTPHLDRLARESLTFRRGYVPSSLCCPSLASIITGLYPHQHGVTSNDPPLPPGMAPGAFQRSPQFAAGRESMNARIENLPTIPRVLASHGYPSLQTGKWWQGRYTRGGFTAGMTRGDRHGDDGLEIGRKTMQPIHDFIAKSQADHKPFFVWYAPLMPHEPHTPPDRLLTHYLDKTPSPQIARYWAMIEWFDETVGDLLAQLDQRGLARDTIVIYLADNGWIQNPDGPRYAPKSKQSPYDGGLRTPLMVRWPARVTPRMSDQLAISLDIMPTLLAAVGDATVKNLQGINLLDEQAVAARRAIYGECFTHNAVDLDRPAASLRWRWTVDGDWKLIVPDPVNEPDARIELYDLSHDPHETANRAATEPQRVKQLTAQLNAWWNPSASGAN